MLNNKDDKWYMDQYNRNRKYSDQVKDWNELKNKLTGIVTDNGTKIVSYNIKLKVNDKRKKTL